MTDQTGFSTFIRKKLVEFGWLPQVSKLELSSPSLWDTGSNFWWRDLQHNVKQFVDSFIKWIRSRVWGEWPQNGQPVIPTQELLPGFMDTAEARSWAEFDDQRQVWTAHLDFTHRSLACHLELVNEGSPPLMQHILTPRQIEVPPPE